MRGLRGLHLGKSWLDLGNCAFLSINNPVYLGTDVLWRVVGRLVLRENREQLSQRRVIHLNIEVFDAELLGSPILDGFGNPALDVVLPRRKDHRVEKADYSEDGYDDEDLNEHPFIISQKPVNS